MSKDATISVDSKMQLELKEVRGTSSGTRFKDGFNETSSETRTRFHWRLCGIASKHSVEAIRSDDVKLNDQEVYQVAVISQGFDLSCFGFKSREDAIRNALGFAERSGIEVDGYKASKRQEVPA